MHSPFKQKEGMQVQPVFSRTQGYTPKVKPFLDDVND